MYLGGYDKEEHAAEAYDVAALKTKGKHVKTNFDATRCAPRRLGMSSVAFHQWHVMGGMSLTHCQNCQK